MAAEIDYTKFRWFFTSSGVLVIGGKSAESNEEVVKQANDDDLVFHTEEPGSPFCLIVDDIEETEEDIREAAVFCASLSKQWKNKKKEIDVGYFRGVQLKKGKGMKKGTFSVNGAIKKIKVVPKLYLTFQEGKLRCVPFETDIAVITPGSLKKEQAAEAISSKLKIKKEEVLGALPSDNIEIKWL